MGLSTLFELLNIEKTLWGMCLKGKPANGTYLQDKYDATLTVIKSDFSVKDTSFQGVCVVIVWRGYILYDAATCFRRHFEVHLLSFRQVYDDNVFIWVGKTIAVVCTL